MTNKEIKDYIKENLKIAVVPLGNEFEIKLLLEGDTISKAYYYIDD